nr:MAG TPA: hypothetical protein [Caudoviricetes sp.]
MRVRSAEECMIVFISRLTSHQSARWSEGFSAHDG